MRLELIGSGAELDPEVLAEVVALRLFLESRFGPTMPGRTTPSQGYCFHVARLGRLALNRIRPGRWRDWEGHYVTDAALTELAAGRVVMPHELDDFAEPHGFLMDREGLVIDLTADQFGRGDLVVCDEADRHYAPRRDDDDSEMARASEWDAEWAVEREDWLAAARETLGTSPVMTP